MEKIQWINTILLASIAVTLIWAVKKLIVDGDEDLMTASYSVPTVLMLGWIYAQNKEDANWIQILSSLATLAATLWVLHGIVAEADYWKVPFLLPIFGAAISLLYSRGELTVASVLAVAISVLSITWILHGVLQEQEFWKLPFLLPAIGIVYTLKTYHSVPKSNSILSPRVAVGVQTGQ